MVGHLACFTQNKEILNGFIISVQTIQDGKQIVGRDIICYKKNFKGKC